MVFVCVQTNLEVGVFVSCKWMKKQPNIRGAVKRNMSAMKAKHEENNYELINFFYKKDIVFWQQPEYQRPWT